MNAIARGAYVRHKVYAHRGLGKVLEVGPTLLRSQTPKLRVGWHIGGPLWHYPDDLIVVEAPCASGPQAAPVVEHAPVVA